MSTNDNHKWYLASSDPTQAELNDAHDRGIDLYNYPYAREHGATHNEILDAHSKGINIYGYAAARESGATHNEALDAHDRGINLYGYDCARKSGATHKEALDAHSKGIDLYDYGFARESGATHKEALDAHSKGINIYGYAAAKAYGATHNEVLDAHDKGIDLHGYSAARAYGATHNETLDAHDRGINIWDYVSAKQKNNTHYEILKKLVKDYNPYSEINWKNASSDDDFGISKREQSEMAGRAIGEHIWDKMEDIFGPMKLQHQLHTVGELAKRFPDHIIQVDESDEPYVSHKVGDWEGRYFDGPYSEMHHVKHGPMELIDVGREGDPSEGKDRKITPAELRGEVEHFVKHDAQQYVDSAEYNGRSSSKWHLASFDLNFENEHEENWYNNSTAITSAASLLTGVSPGWWTEKDNPDWAVNSAKHFIGSASKINDHLYHGSVFSRKLNIGDEYHVPLMATSKDIESAKTFARLGGDEGEILHFIPGSYGTPVQKSEGPAKEIVVNGKYKVIDKKGNEVMLKSLNRLPIKQASPGGTCLGCGTPLSTRMDSYCPTCTDIMSQSNDLDYMQTNPNHPEARPFQMPHDFSGNE